MKPYNLKNFTAKFPPDEVEKCESFQRRETWTSKEVNRFFQALSRHRARQPITMADAYECWKYSARKQNLGSRDFYKDLLGRNKMHVNIDGQNRTRKIYEVINNKLTLTGTFKDADGKECVVKNTFFKDLPQRLQDHLLTGCELMVDIIEDALAHELSDIFQDINSGVPLNAQEIRNSFRSPIAAHVRKQSKKERSLFNCLISGKGLKRMGDDEMVAKVIMALLPMSNPDNGKDWGFSSKAVDTWYKLGINSGTSIGTLSLYGDVAHAESVFELMGVIVRAQKTYDTSSLMPKALFWALVWACDYVIKQDKQINCYSTFFEELKRLDDVLTADSNVVYANAYKQAIKSSKKPPSQSAYYFRQADLPHQSKEREARRADLVAEIIKSFAKLTISKKQAVA